MATRSPLNKRYQKDAQIGSTRKSAASVKLKRAAGHASESSASSKSSAKKGASAKRSATTRSRIELPPEVKKLQKVMFSMLGAAVVFSLVYLWKGNSLGVAGSVMLGLAYALMFAALYIDFTRVRPVIKAMQKGGTPTTTSKPGKSEKSDKAGKAK